MYCHKRHNSLLQRKTIFFGLLFIVFMFSSSLPVSAHKVSIFAWVEDDTVFTESYFPDGTLVCNGKISVYDSSDTLVVNGQTDTQGEFSFKVPKVDEFTIVLDASMGHRATFILAADEISATYGGPTAAREDSGGSEIGGVSGVEPEGRDSLYTQYEEGITLDDIRRVVEEEVSRQVKPLYKNIAELQKKERISVQEVFAGIGYILGLMGLVMYFKSKGKK